MSDRVRTLLRGVGQTLMTLGVVVLLFAVYTLYGTGLVTSREQERLADDLEATWAEPGARPQPGQQVPVAFSAGQGFARLHVPALPGFQPWVVVEGVGVEDLKKGPGHIPGTALPGEVGNVVLSGHRTTYGAPFNRFDELDPGEQVVVETREAWYTYTVRGSSIVAPTAVEVTLPVPGKPGAKPTERLLTFTTCNPEYSARQRLIVLSVLSDVTPRAEGPPALLRTGG